MFWKWWNCSQIFDGLNERIERRGGYRREFPRVLDGEDDVVHVVGDVSRTW